MSVNMKVLILPDASQNASINCSLLWLNVFHDILTERVSSSDPPKYRFTTVNGYLYLKVSSSISFEKGEFSELVVAVVSCSLNVRCLLSAQFLQNNSCTVLQFFILINTLSGGVRYEQSPLWGRGDCLPYSPSLPAYTLPSHNPLPFPLTLETSHTTRCSTFTGFYRSISFLSSKNKIPRSKSCKEKTKTGP